MIFVAHFGFYVLFVIGILLFIAVRWALAGRFTAGCRATVCGLVASLFGLVWPFALFTGLDRLYTHHSLPGGGEYIDSSALPFLLVFGPLIGPPVFFALAVLLYHRRSA